MEKFMRCYSCMKEKLNNEEICPHCGYNNGNQEDEHYYLVEGTLLDHRYLIGKVLGHGGFGITYIGLNMKLDLKVAIKEYLPTDLATRTEGQSTVKSFTGDKRDQFNYGLKSFLDEAKTLARYNGHPCIVSTIDFVDANDTSYLIMEYLDGISLSEYLKRKGGSLLFQEALTIMMPVMDALREVHKSGMIHRDISPDNIYITKTGQVKLLDFGAARFALGEKSKSLSVILKPGYAPPEQYTSRGKQGAWTDVYATAATLYRMVEGKNLYEAMDRMMDDHIEFSEATPTEYRDMFERALKVKADERLQSVESLQEMLQLDDSQKIDLTQKVEIDNNDATVVDVMQIKKIEKQHQLELHNMSISKVINIDQLVWLEELDLSYNQLTEIYGFRQLSKLTELDISSNDIKDISEIIYSTELYSLNIANNLIADISMLKDLKKLKYLWIIGNPIQDNVQNRESLIELYERGCYINGSPFMEN